MIAPAISTVVRLMKGTVFRQAGVPVWQKGFYDHVIRSENDHWEIWNFIEAIPASGRKISYIQPFVNSILRKHRTVELNRFDSQFLNFTNQ